MDVARRKVIFAACAAAGATGLAIAAPASGAVGRGAASSSHWRVVASVQGVLDAIVAPTSTSAWALGWGAHPPDGSIFPVGRAWNGHRWSRAQLPGINDSGMSCAGASSPANVWAFTGAGSSGGNPPGTVSALRLRRGKWVIAEKFPAISYVTGCNVLSRTDVWAFGGEVAGLGPGIGTWHFNGATWRKLNTGRLILFNASVVSGSNIWATGAVVLPPKFIPEPLLGHWNGRTWRAVRSITSALPAPSASTGVGLRNIKAFSSRDIWVSAFVSHRSGPVATIVVHWNGRRWSRVRPGSAGYYLPAAVSDGQGGWWSVPYGIANRVRFLWHRRENGRWIRFPLPVALTSFSLAIAHVPGTGAMLAAGGLKTFASSVVLAFGRLPG